MKSVNIGGKVLFPGKSMLIVAEAGVNHNGSLEMALKLIDEAKKTGADAVKFQTFITEEVITRKSPKANYHIATTGDDAAQTWFDLIKSEELSQNDFIAIKQHCDKVGIIFISTPYDMPSVDLLDEIDVAAYKVASTDTNNHPLLAHIAKKGRPVILSTGMSEMEEIAASVKILRDNGCDQLIVTQCTAEYPAPIEDCNLLAMLEMGRVLDVAYGYSDHVPGEIAAIASVALGSCFYERHFTLDKNLPGPDHRASSDPAELSQLIANLRLAMQAMGDGKKRIMPSEAKNRSKLRKNVVSLRKISAGEVLSTENIGIKRVGGIGIGPEEFTAILGRRLKVSTEEEVPITADILE